MRSGWFACVLLVACHRDTGLIRVRYGEWGPYTSYWAKPERVAIAAADGHVVQATRMRPNRLCLLLVHDPPVPHQQFFTLYCGLRGVMVARPGRAVVRGDVIGTVAPDGDLVDFQMCTAPCTSSWFTNDADDTLDPEKHMAGCYEPGRQYDPAQLTRPVPCRN
jgi:hypothetical protein